MKALSCWLVMAAATAQEAVTVALAPGDRVTGYLSVDCNGDGLRDLAVATHNPRKGERAIALHLQAPTAPRFRSAPDQPPYLVEPDVVAFCFADADPAPGRELVLCTAERVVVVTRSTDGTPAYRALLPVNLLWPAAADEAVLPLTDALVDADGDGQDDLLLPEPDGALLVRNLRLGEGASTRRLQLPTWRTGLDDASVDGVTRVGNRLKLEFREADDDDGGARRRRGGELLEVSTRAPLPFLLDVDGDQQKELCALRNRALWYVPLAAGALGSLQIPVPPDRLKVFDPSYSLVCQDMDGDGRSDLLLTSSANSNDEVEVRMDYYRCSNGGLAKKPDSRLRTQAHAQPPQLVDVDGDGKLDLVAMTLRLDALRALTGGGEVVLEVQCNVFRGLGNRFTQPAMLARVLRVPGKAEAVSGAFVTVLPAVAGGRAALLHREGNALLLEPFAGSAGDLHFAAKQAYQLPSKSQLTLLDPSSGLVAINGEAELRIVRMR